MGALPKKHVTQDAVLEALEVVATGLGAKIEAAEARTSAKIDAAEARTNAKIDALDRKVDEKTDALDAKIGALEAKVDRHQMINSDNFIELNRKLNVLMAHFGVTDEKQS